MQPLNFKVLLLIFKDFDLQRLDNPSKLQVAMHIHAITCSKVVLASITLHASITSVVYVVRIFCISFFEPVTKTLEIRFMATYMEVLGNIKQVIHKCKELLMH